MKGRAKLLFMCAALLALSVPLYNYQVVSVINSIWSLGMTSFPARLQATFQSTKTICFGRFMIDVPSDALVVYGPTAAPSEIIRYTGEYHQIAEHLSEKKRGA